MGMWQPWACPSCRRRLAQRGGRTGWGVGCVSLFCGTGVHASSMPFLLPPCHPCCARPWGNGRTTEGRGCEHDPTRPSYKSPVHPTFRMPSRMWDDTRGALERQGAQGSCTGDDVGSCSHAMREGCAHSHPCCPSYCPRSHTSPSPCPNGGASLYTIHAGREGAEEVGQGLCVTVTTTVRLT